MTLPSSSKIKIFMAYPYDPSGKRFTGLSFVDTLFSFFSEHPETDVVGPQSPIDVLFFLNGGYPGSTYKSRFIERMLRFGGRFSPKIGASAFRLPNLAAEAQLRSLMHKNPRMKIIHRLDDRYHLICKRYGFDKTVASVNSISHATILQSRYCQSLYDRDIKTIFGVITKMDVTNPHVIYNPVDTDIYKPEGDRAELHGKIRIFHVASTGMARKGLGKVLEIAHLLKDNPDIQFYLMGRQNTDPVYGHTIGSYRNVHQLGMIDDKQKAAAYLRSGDILLFPSENDCSPNAVLEAMACGMAVVAVNSGGTPELFLKDDMKAGALIHPQNPVYALKVVIDHLDHYKRNAVQIINEHHSKQIIGNQVLELIKSIL